MATTVAAVAQQLEDRLEIVQTQQKEDTEIDKYTVCKLQQALEQIAWLQACALSVAIA